MDLLDENVRTTLLTPLRLASKALYLQDDPDTEHLGPAIGRAARYLVREGDTILIVGDDGTWLATDVHFAAPDEVTVEVFYEGNGPKFYFESFPWDRVRLPWRHYDDHIQRMKR